DNNQILILTYYLSLKNLLLSWNKYSNLYFNKYIYCKLHNYIYIIDTIDYINLLVIYNYLNLLYIYIYNNTNLLLYWNKILSLNYWSSFSNIKYILLLEYNTFISNINLPLNYWINNALKTSPNFIFILSNTFNTSNVSHINNYNDMLFI